MCANSLKLLIPLFGALCGVTDGIAQVGPPQGYIGFQRAFPDPPPVYYDGAQEGHYTFEYDFLLGNISADLAGTFWSNSIRFRHSAANLPPNHVGGSQGGYLGVQVKSASESIAIFSVWWALDAEPGPGGHCVEQVEAWYNDNRPFDPPIHTMSDTDPARPVAGGPFRSCRLPIELEPGIPYRLRLTEVADAGQPDEPEWWAATLVNLATDDEQLIGRLLLPGSWGWLDSSAGGFIEHFGPMPSGCDSIPASSSVFLAARADNGAFESSISASLYGTCEASLRSRTRIDCADRRCTVQVGPAVQPPRPPELQ